MGLHRDSRGVLGVIELAKLPFSPRRFFWISDVSFGISRAGHAHRICSQLLFGLTGSVTATVISRQGSQRETILRAGDSLLISPKHWLTLTNFTRDAVLGVFASEPYDPAEYITDFVEFSQLVTD